MKTYLFIGPLDFQGCVGFFFSMFFVVPIQELPVEQKKPEVSWRFCWGAASTAGNHTNSNPQKGRFIILLFHSDLSLGWWNYQTHIMPQKQPFTANKANITHLWGPTAVHRWAKETGCFLCQFDWPSSLHLLHMRRGEPRGVAGVMRKMLVPLGWGPLNDQVYLLLKGSLGVKIVRVPFQGFSHQPFSLWWSFLFSNGFIFQEGKRTGSRRETYILPHEQILPILSPAKITANLGVCCNNIVSSLCA